jgi:hypothetical protein
MVVPVVQLRSQWVLVTVVPASSIDVTVGLTASTYSVGCGLPYGCGVVSGDGPYGGGAIELRSGDSTSSAGGSIRRCWRDGMSDGGDLFLEAVVSRQQQVPLVERYQLPVVRVLATVALPLSLGGAATKFYG